MAEVVNINNVLDGHVVLDLECLDRVYLNGYVPNLQVGGQVVTFLTQHLGNPVPSPALFKQIGNRFREAVRSFAEINSIPVLHLNTPDRSRWDDRKLDHVRELVDKATTPGVVAIVIAQEVQKVFMGYRRPSKIGAQFGFDALSLIGQEVRCHFLGPGVSKCVPREVRHTSRFRQDLHNVIGAAQRKRRRPCGGDVVK